MHVQCYQQYHPETVSTEAQQQQATEKLSDSSQHQQMHVQPADQCNGRDASKETSSGMPLQRTPFGDMSCNDGMHQLPVQLEDRIQLQQQEHSSSQQTRHSVDESHGQASMANNLLPAQNHAQTTGSQHVPGITSRSQSTGLPPKSAASCRTSADFHGGMNGLSKTQRRYWQP